MEQNLTFNFFRSHFSLFLVVLSIKSGAAFLFFLPLPTKDIDGTKREESWVRASQKASIFTLSFFSFPPLHIYFNYNEKVAFTTSKGVDRITCEDSPFGRNLCSVYSDPTDRKRNNFHRGQAFFCVASSFLDCSRSSSLTHSLATQG